MSSLLETIAFRQPRRAQTEMAALESGLTQAIQNTIEILLVSAADPDTAVHYLTSLKQQKPDAFERLARSQAGLQNLIAVFRTAGFCPTRFCRILTGSSNSPRWIACCRPRNSRRGW